MYSLNRPLRLKSDRSFPQPKIKKCLLRMVNLILKMIVIAVTLAIQVTLATATPMMV